jgi:hypothetical protein
MKRKEEVQAHEKRDNHHAVDTGGEQRPGGDL